MLSLVVVFTFILWMLLSVVVRASIIRARAAGDIPAASSPLADAIRETLAMAGGIYLALLAVVSFLALNVPDRVSVTGIEVDPVALLALLLVSVGPYWPRRSR